ncbi:MAG: hypothetical protein NT099_01340 [Candidatus Saganbacteria bacterium]|nr:hypothetical protein [Candidatus Saganbacteria bacterium]
MTVRFYTFQDKKALKGRVAVIAHLRTAWESKKGVMQGDPSLAESAQLGRFTASFFPWRRKDAEDQLQPSLQAEHTEENCRLCDPEVIDRQGIARVEVNGRPYLILINYRPVTVPHMIVVKPPEEAHAALCQHIQAETDLSDLAEIFKCLPAELSLTFNSNPGRIGGTGASINHFHWHILSFDGQFIRLAYTLNPLFHSQRAEQGINVGRALSWPANHRIFEGDLDKVAALAHQYMLGLGEENRAYNLAIITPTNPENTKLVVTPRRRPLPISSFRGIYPYQSFGGENVLGYLGGGISQELFEVLKKYPGEAERVIEIWLQEITATDCEMGELDQKLLSRLS